MPWPRIETSKRVPNTVTVASRATTRNGRAASAVTSNSASSRQQIDLAFAGREGKPDRAVGSKPDRAAIVELQRLELRGARQIIGLQVAASARGTKTINRQAAMAIPAATGRHRLKTPGGVRASICGPAHRAPWSAACASRSSVRATLRQAAALAGAASQARHGTQPDVSASPRLIVEEDEPACRFQACAIGVSVHGK